MADNQHIVYKSYLDLLQDDRYLLWRLSPTEELDTYWADSLRRCPELQDQIQTADQYLKKSIYRKQSIRLEDKERILFELAQLVEKRKRKQKRKIVVRTWGRYMAAASILFLMGFLLYRIIMPGQEGKIVINHLETEDIQLITAKETTSFKENIDIRIDNEGVAQIQNGDQGREEITVDKDTHNKLIVPYGKRSKIELSDGTKIWLNSGSTLEFPSKFYGDKREIALTGEMYIEVTENKKMPFFVQTPLFKVQVLGTQFNVSAYEKQIQSVVLVGGSVDLKLKDGAYSCQLIPNEMAVIQDDNTISKQQVDVFKYICWTKGYIMLNEATISDVLKYIERYYNLSFEYIHATNLQNMTCNGKLYLSDKIDNVMRSIALLSNTQYRKEHNTIYITNK